MLKVRFHFARSFRLRYRFIASVKLCFVNVNFWIVDERHDMNGVSVTSTIFTLTLSLLHSIEEISKIYVLVANTLLVLQWLQRTSVFVWSVSSLDWPLTDATGLTSSSFSSHLRFLLFPFTTDHPTSQPPSSSSHFLPLRF